MQRITMRVCTPVETGHDFMKRGGVWIVAVLTRVTEPAPADQRDAGAVAAAAGRRRGFLTPLLSVGSFCLKKNQKNTSKRQRARSVSESAREAGRR